MAGVRRKPQSSGKYQGYFVTMDGRRNFFVGTRSRPETLRMAQRLEDEHRQVRLGYRPPPSPSDRHRMRLVAEVVQEYLAWGQLQGGRRGYGWSPIHLYKRQTHLTWWQQQLSLDVLGDLEECLSQVEAALQHLQEQRRAGKTLANYVEALTAFCDWCLTRKYLAAHPLRALSPLATILQTRRRAMTVVEMQQLFASAPMHHRLLYETACVSGLRANELRSLTLAHLDGDQRGVHLDARWTKNRQAGFQPLPRSLVEELFLFASAGYPRDLYAHHLRRQDATRRVPEEPLLFVPTSLVRMFDQDLARAGIPKWAVGSKLDFHALRVAYVKLVLESDADVKDTLTLTRHATPEMTLRVYGRTREGRLQTIIEQIGARLQLEPACASSVHSTAVEGHTHAVNAENITAYSSPKPMELRGIEPLTS